MYGKVIRKESVECQRSECLNLRRVIWEVCLIELWINIVFKLGIRLNWKHFEILVSKVFDQAT